MPGLRAKLRNRDHGLNSITSNNVAPDTLEIGDLKKLDTGDSTGVNAETLPYTHTSLTPTIWTKIESIIAGTDFVASTITTDGISLLFTMAYAVDTSKPYLVWYNGQLMSYTDDYTFPDTTHIQFTFVPIGGLKINLFFQQL